MKHNKLLIPVLRKIVPHLVANQIAGVQPMMTAGVGGIFRSTQEKFFLIDQTTDGLWAPPAGYVTVDVITEISQWIEQHPLSMWKPGDVPAYNPMMDRFTISEELYTLMALKWA